MRHRDARSRPRWPFSSSCSRLLSACQREPAPPAATTTTPAPATASPAAPDCRPRIYVSDETGGNVIVIDPEAGRVVERIAVGKRPRGLRISRDGTQLLVALSGSAIAGPGVDESKLPPADRAADGIGVVDLTAHKLTRTIQSGPDPEAFDLSHGRQDALRLQRRRRADVGHRRRGRDHQEADRRRRGARRRHDAAGRPRGLRDVRRQQRSLRDRHDDRQGRGADEDRCEAAVDCLHGRRRDRRS